MSFNPKALRFGLGLVAGTFAIAGCTLGPDYRGAPPVAPNASHATAFNRAPKDITPAAPSSAAWWKSLNDPELNQLIETALVKGALKLVAIIRTLLKIKCTAVGRMLTLQSVIARSIMAVDFL